MSISTKTVLSFVAFDGTCVELHGQFLVSKCSDGSPRHIGDITLSESNRIAMRTLNHGELPSIPHNDKGEESAPELPCDPIRDLPLWRYVKPSKKEGTCGRVIPIQSVFNRPTDETQTKDLRESLVRKGFDTKVRIVTIAVDDSGYAYFVDGGHINTAIAQLMESEYDFDNPKHLLNSSNVVTVQVIQSSGGISGFDELQRARQVKDMLSALGLSPGWESEVQVVLSSLCLLCSGKGLKGSGKQLPHLVGDNGKPRKLVESEIATLFTSSIPGFEKIRQCLDTINKQTLPIVTDDGKLDCPLVEYPTFNRYSLPAWILAMIEVSYSAKLDLDSIVTKLVKVIADDQHPVTSKINSWANVGTKGSLEYQYPILCSILFALFDANHGGSPLPSRKPSSRSSCLVKIAYDAWHDEQSKK